MIDPESKFKEPFFVSPEEKKKLINRLRELLSQREEIIFAYLFGSLVEGESFHDIDVAIYGREAFSLAQLFELANLLESEIGYPVDLVEMRQAGLGLKMHIFRTGLLLFSRDEELRTDLMEECARKYPEYAHFRNFALGIEGVRESYLEISKLLSLSTEEHLLKRELLGALKYELIVSVEAIMNILSHLLVKTRGVTPQGYVDVLIKAKEKHLLSEGLSQKLLSLVRLRNLLVHRYWDIDDKLFIENAKENKEDLLNFLEEIETFLKIEIQKGEKDA